MVRISHILGMNARNQVFCAKNPKEAKRYGFSKLRAKEFLKKHGIKVPELYFILKTQDELAHTDWSTIPNGFAVKPSNGSAGKGVLVIAKKVKGGWLDIEGHKRTIDDLRFHSRNILDGQYSTWGSRAHVIVEERIPIHPDLEKYAEVGTPDVRVIVFNKIPVMAMLRLPTKASGGRANLDQGAIALGIDMGTGKSVLGVSGKKKTIKYFPGTQHLVTGVQIPFWTDVLKTAVRAANATGLIFMGADIFLHPEKGPMVAEVNAFPGLSIQLANRAGLKRRLLKLEDIEAHNVNQAVKIGQSLFAESFPTTTLGETERVILSPKEEVEIYGERNKKKKGLALMNTSRVWSAISFDAANQLGLTKHKDESWTQYIDGEGNMVVVEVKLKMRDKIIKTHMIVSKKLQGTKFLIHLGRRDLTGFLVGEQR